MHSSVTCIGHVTEKQMLAKQQSWLQHWLTECEIVMQASETTAQGLWLAGVCGIILAAVVWFGGPLAVASKCSVLIQLM